VWIAVGSGPYSAQFRADRISQRLQDIVRDRSLRDPTVNVVEADGSSELRVGPRLIMAVTAADAKSIGAARASMAAQYAKTFEDAIRAVGRFMAESDGRDPDWLPTLAEFVAHAARDEPLRRRYVRVRERFLAAIADVIETLCDRHGLALRVPPLEAARASSVLARGYSAERRLDPDAASSDVFIELHAGFMRGLTLPKERSHA